jgi:hypothetical protein
MLKRYTFWLWAAVVFQLLTAAVHSISLFVGLEPANETERQLITLMTTYKLDAGGGFQPTFSNLFTALSSCFSFVCLLGGLINFYLLSKKADAGLVKGITGINVLVFGAIFVVIAVFTFLPPIICTGLIFACLVLAFATNRPVPTSAT